MDECPYCNISLEEHLDEKCGHIPFETEDGLIWLVRNDYNLEQYNLAEEAYMEEVND